MKHKILLFIFSLFLTVNIFALDDAGSIDKANKMVEKSFEYRDTDRNKSISLLNDALAIFQEEQNSEGLARTFSAIALWYIDINQWDTSLSLSLKALNLGEKLQDSLIQAEVFLNLGVIYLNLKNYETSLKYTNAAYAYGEPFAKASAYSNMGLIYSRKHQPDSALTYFQKANKIFLSINDTSAKVLSNIAVTNINMGSIALQKRDFDNAKKFFNQSLLTCYRINDFNSIILNYLNFGKVFTEEKNFELAEDMIQRANSIADSLELNYLANLTLYSLSEMNFAKLDYEQAYVLLKKFTLTKDSLVGVDIENKIANLQMKYQVEKQESKITNLENEQKLNTYKIFITALIILLLASIIIYVLNKRRLTIKATMAITESQRESTQIKLEKAKEDIVHYTKLVKENNERIERFEKDLMHVNKVDTAELKLKQEELRNMKILKDEDWVYYKNLFKDVYIDFFEKMMGIPKLTEGDKRQILLLKMGYTNKMSADVLGISTEGIKRARQRLAKKLNLQDAGKLEDYFNNL